MPASPHPAFTDIDTRLEELEEQGYTIFPQYLQSETTAAVRAHIDHLAGPVTSAPSNKARRDLRHPIPGAIMAQLASNPVTLELAARLIGSDPTNLRMREQVLIRSDPSTPPYEPARWHIDAAFNRAEFAARPKQVYYQMLHCCSQVNPGGAAFHIIPGSHKKSLANPALQQQPTIETQTLSMPELGPDAGVEICVEDGDLVVFNPLCYHAASPNRTQQPRYVLFTSFYHPSATRLVELVRRTKYRDQFPDSLRQALPAHLQSLLDN
ncbi:MAG: hypothetical protein GKR89_20390 [Candidatus Latescibacteria bacterium]|nr:hypothetical protein [Candidatus Latescibacterota bacterium]